VELWKEVIELNQNDPDAFLNIGYAYLKLEKYREALDSSRRATELDPSMKEAALNYAGSEFLIGDIRKLFLSLKRCCRRTPIIPRQCCWSRPRIMLRVIRKKDLNSLRNFEKGDLTGQISSMNTHGG